MNDPSVNLKTRMKLSEDNQRSDALTLIEVIVVIAVMVVLVGLLVPWSTNAPSQRTSCARYLKSTGVAARIFATDNEDKWPWQVSTTEGGSREFQNVPNSAFRHFQVMSNELSTPKIIVCPEDKRRTWATNWVIGFNNQNLSYFVGFNASETNASSLLSGDRYLTTSRPPMNGFLELTPKDAVSWAKDFHQYKGNLLLGDGSVQMSDSASLQKALHDSGVATNRLAIP